MGWAVGLIVAAAVGWAVSKLIGAKRHVQLIVAAQSHLQVAFRIGSPFDKTIDARVWHDPYLLGYAQGSVSVMTAIYGAKLSTTERGVIFIKAMRNMVGEEYRDVCERITTLQAAKNSAFQRGVKNGGDVAIMMAERPGPELLADPDVQAALRDAPGASKAVATVFGPSNVGTFGAAGGVLLSNFMKAHQEERGW